MAIENTVSSDFDPRPSIAKRVFDCRLSGVRFCRKILVVYSRMLCDMGLLI